MEKNFAAAIFPPVAVSPSPLALSNHNPESGDNDGSSRRGGIRARRLDGGRRPPDNLLCPATPAR